MTIIRLTATLFILLLLATATMGWVWTGTHQTGGPLVAARLVLALSAAAGVVGLVALWRWPRRA